MKKEVRIEEFIRLLQKAKDEHGNIKIGTVTDKTVEMNHIDKKTLGRWKYAEVLQYNIQLITKKLILQDNEESKDINYWGVVPNADD